MQNEVWSAMGDHFLDTETRHGIPATAACCLRAGLGVELARNVWCFEVSPALAANLWNIAGEWSGWDPDWLAERIAAVRVRPSRLAYLRYRCSVHYNHRVWLAIERCLEVLLAVPPDSRDTVARDLSTLAKHYFDFVPNDLAGCGKAEVARLEALCATALHVLEPAALGRERRTGPARVRAALDAGRAGR